MDARSGGRSAKAAVGPPGGAAAPSAHRSAAVRLLVPGVALAGLAVLALAVLVLALLGLTVLALLPGAANAAPAAGGAGWNSIYPGPAGAPDPTAQAVVAAPDGSVFVAGLAGTGPTVPWLLKYDTAGDLLWHQGPSTPAARSVTFAGLTPLPLGVLAWGVAGRDIRVERYQTASNRLWAVSIKGSSAPGGTPRDVAVDRGRHIYVAGSLGTRAGLRVRLVKLGGGGRVFWQRVGAAGELESARIGAHGNVFACGWVVRGGRVCGLLTSYSPSGGRRWSVVDRHVGFSGLTAAPSGTVYVCGWQRMSATLTRALVRAYAPSGHLLWSRAAQAEPGRSAYFATLARDAGGGVVCAGTSVSVDNPLGLSEAPADFLVARYGTNGTRTLLDTWAGQSGVEQDEVVGVECPASGGFLVCGDSLRYEGTSRLVVIPYDASGTRGLPLTHATAGSFEQARASVLTPTGPVIAGTVDAAGGGARQAITVQFAYPGS